MSNLQYFLDQNNKNIDTLNAFVAWLKDKDNFNTHHQVLSMKIEEWQAYEGKQAKYKPLFDGLGYLFGVEEYLGAIPDGIAISDYCAGVLVIKTQDLSIGVSLYIGQGSELSLLLWNLDEPKEDVWKKCKHYSPDELIYISERHLRDLKQDNLNITRNMETKEYPLHDEEHEIISTPIIPGKKRMTAEEYEDKITELLTQMKALQETVDKQNKEISEMKGKLCLP